MKLSLIALLAIGGLTGCTKEYFVDNSIIGTQSDAVFFQIAESDWIWNVPNQRFECIKDINSINQHIYDDGTILTSLFIQEDGFEAQKILPFIQTFEDVGGDIYTQTVSFDVVLGVGNTPSTIAFYVQVSDLHDASNFFNYYDTHEFYEFKVSLFWE